MKNLTSTGGKGSSPHARGTLTTANTVLTSLGIIPACAGNTDDSYPSHIRIRDHPRMRGEHPLAAYPLKLVGGSSPHARGTQFHPIQLACSQGIIPAFTDEYIHRDHPRMRGEHAAAGGRDGGHTGSSPHARGTRLMVLSLGLCSGIIPACAGNTP